MGGDVGDEVVGFEEEFAGAVETDFGEVVFEAEAGGLMEEAAEVLGGNAAFFGEVAETDGLAEILPDGFTDVVNFGGEDVFGGDRAGGLLVLEAAVNIAEAEVNPVADGLNLFGGEPGGGPPLVFPFDPGEGASGAGGVGPGGPGFVFAAVGIAVADEQEVAEGLVVDAEGVDNLAEAGGAAEGRGILRVEVGEEAEAVADAGVAGGGMGVEGAAEGAGFAPGVAEEVVAEGVEEEGVESGEVMEVLEEGPEGGGAEEAGAEGFLEAVGHGSVDEGLNGLCGAVVEEPAEAGGEDELAVEGVFEAGEAEASGALPGVGEEEAGDEGQEGGEGVEEEGMGPAEEEGVDDEHEASVSEEGAVALQEKGAEKKVLWEDGEEGVKEQDEEPESGPLAGEAEEEAGIQEEGEEAEEEGGGEETKKDAAEMGAGGGAGGRLAELNPGVEEGEQNCERGHAEEDVKKGDAAVELQVNEEDG